MGADVSRVRFDPQHDHSAVRLQQGRLLLDSDFNEQVTIADRRVRALPADLAPGVKGIGGGVATVSRLTPDAFKITMSGGEVQIGAGRMYVDGLLAENHGTGTPGFDAVLAEPNAPDPVSYPKQPYWPVPDNDLGTGPHLAYLDVWPREVSHLIEPDLVDPAVGVDTTVRTQTAWQVRFHPVGGDVTCAMPVELISGWDAVTAPSAARLTTDTVPVPDDEDLCELPPTGGYRGPENQTYRVELHDGGGLGSATFKWSRENASVVTAVVNVVPPTELLVASLGRDSVLRFSTGDWVEVLDDNRELSRKPGHMCRVTVEDATNTLTLSAALPNDLIPTGNVGDTAADRHLRVIRWDQHGQTRDDKGVLLVDLDTAPSGVVPVPSDGAGVVLEHGVTVKFDFEASGDGRLGDYWVFAARTTGTSIEKLVQAPPLGVHHHFARLAIITLPSGTPLSDCRFPPPEDTGGGCVCEICVTPGGHSSGELTIQAAVDLAAASGGGTVNLCPGTYELSGPVTLNGTQSVHVRGHGGGTVIQANGTAFAMNDVSGVTLSRLRLEIGGDEEPGIKVAGGQSVLIEDLMIGQLAGDMPDVSLGTTWQAIALSGAHYGNVIRGCSVVAPFGIVATASATGGDPFVVNRLHIERNAMLCTKRAVDIPSGDLFREVLVAGNTIGGCADVAISLLCSSASEMFDGRVVVSGNVLEIPGAGIVTTGSASIVDNQVMAGSSNPGMHGVHVTGTENDKPGAAHVISNRVTGFGGYGILVEAPVSSAFVKQNVLRRTGNGIQVAPPVTGGEVAVDNNHVIEVVPLPTGTEDAVVPTLGQFGPSIGGTLQLGGGVPVGIRVLGVETVAVLGNTVHGVDVTGAIESTHLGIAVADCGDARVTGNIVTVVSADQVESLAIGIGVWTWTRSATVQDNIVNNGDINELKIHPSWIPFNVDGAEQHPAALTVTGNTAHGGGIKPAVQLAILGDAILSTNVFLQPPGTDALVVDASAATATVQGNQLRAGKSPNMALATDPHLAVVIGNLSSGDILVSGTPVTATGRPWSQLNAILP